MRRPAKPPPSRSAPARLPGTGEPTALDRALTAAEHDRLRRDRGFVRLREQADRAAAEADRGNDAAYRMLAEAIRRLLRG